MNYNNITNVAIDTIVKSKFNDLYFPTKESLIFLIGEIRK